MRGARPARPGSPRLGLGWAGLGGGGAAAVRTGRQDGEPLAGPGQRGFVLGLMPSAAVEKARRSGEDGLRGGRGVLEVQVPGPRTAPGPVSPATAVRWRSGGQAAAAAFGLPWSLIGAGGRLAGGRGGRGSDKRARGLRMALVVYDPCEDLAPFSCSWVSGQTGFPSCSAVYCACVVSSGTEKDAQ